MKMWHEKGDMMRLFHKKESKDQSQETLEHNYKESTKEIIGRVNCPHQVFVEGSQPDVVNQAYRKAQERGRQEGFVPILVQSDDTLAEWLGILDDESYSRESVLQQDRQDAGEILKQRYEDCMEIYEDSSVDRETWENERDNELMGRMEGGEQLDILTSFVSFTGNGIVETILFEIPVENPWEVVAWMPVGGWNECPEASEMMEVCRYWYEKYGAVPAAFSHDTMEFVLDKPAGDEETAWEVAREHYAFCPDRVDQGTATGTLGELADSIRVSTVWYFWWD